MTKKRIVIQVPMTCGKCRRSALALAGSTPGVQSVGIEGKEQDQLVVVGDGVDATSLTSSLRKKVKMGRADIVKVEVVVDEAAAETADSGSSIVFEWPPQCYPYRYHPGGYYSGPQPNIFYPYVGPPGYVEDPCADEDSWCTIM